MSYAIKREDTGEKKQFDDYENATMVHDILIEKEIPCRFSEVDN